MSGNSALSFLFGLFFSIIGVSAARKVAIEYEFLDIPNKRSSHSKPVPRGGGLGLLLGFSVAAVFNVFKGNENPNWPFWAGLIIVAGTGLWDDIKGGLPVSARLVLQSIAAGLVIIFSGRFITLPLPPPMNIDLSGLSYIFSFLWIIIVINFYNFMDGIDGIAGAQAMIAGFALTFSSQGSAAWLGAAIAGSSFGFLLFNWQPASIFLGDVGSYSLGYIFAAAPFIKGTECSYELTMLVGLTLWMFLSDASLTFIRRLLKGEKVWKAHRDHYYQRMVMTGLSHSQTVIFISTCAIAISTVAGLAYRTGEGLLFKLAFCVAVIMTILEVIFVKMRERKPAD